MLSTLQANQHLRALKQAIQAPSNKLYKRKSLNNLVQSKIRHSLLVVVPLGESAECTALVGTEKRHTVDVTGIDPAETNFLLAMAQ